MIIYYIKVVIVAVFISGGVNTFVSSTSFAQQSQLQQQINPYECVYTTIEAGGEAQSDSACDGQPIPLLVSVNVNAGRPILKGTFNASQSSSLHVWINGQQHTLGTDARVTVAGDVWQLDLSGLAAPLHPGDYTVTLEVQTHRGLLLRNAIAGSFTVPLSMPVIVPSLPVTRQGLFENVFLSNVFTPAILPYTQEDAQLPRTVQSPTLPAPVVDFSNGDSNIVMNGLMVQGGYVAIFAIALGVGVWMGRHFMRR